MIYWVTDFEPTQQQLDEVEGVALKPEILFGSPYPDTWIVVYDDVEYPTPPDWLDGYQEIPLPGSQNVYIPLGKVLHLGGSIIMSDSEGRLSVEENGNGTKRVAMGHVIGCGIDAGGLGLVEGVFGDAHVPWDCEINAARLVSFQAGSIVMDIWRKPLSEGFPPVDGDSITGGGEPTLDNEQTYEDTVLDGWTKTLNAGDVLRFNVDSADIKGRVMLTLEVV